jgi:hypothetical protein
MNSLQQPHEVRLRGLWPRLPVRAAGIAVAAGLLLKTIGCDQAGRSTPKPKEQSAKADFVPL